MMLLAAAFPVLGADERLSLTSNEKKWLENVEVIRLCSDPDWMPYEAIDEAGQHVGIMSGFHALWAEMIGKPVEIQRTDSWDQALEFMQQKNVMFYPALRMSPVVVVTCGSPDPLSNTLLPLLPSLTSSLLSICCQLGTKPSPWSEAMPLSK